MTAKTMASPTITAAMDFKAMLIGPPGSSLYSKYTNSVAHEAVIDRVYFFFKDHISRGRVLGMKLLSFFFLFLLCFNTFAKEKSKSIQIICLGDSLTAGYGIEKDKAYPSLIEKKLNETLGEGR